jgi:OmpA-OmpF porin, OOP family
MRNVFLLLTFVAATSLAQQQGGDWTPPPPTPPPAEEPPNPVPVNVSPPPQQQPPPTSAPPPSTTVPATTPPTMQPQPAPATSPTTTAPATAGKPTAAAGPGTPATAGEAKVTIVPGTEPHSPATYPFAWDDRRNERVTAGEIGAIGLWQVESAELGRPGLIRLSVAGEYMSLNNFPVLNASNTRQNGVFALSWVPIEHLEAYVSYGVAADTNSSSSPQLIQTEGDTNLGVIAALHAITGLDMGLDARLLVFPGIGTQSLGQYAAGFSPRALATVDFRDFKDSWGIFIPILFHLNFGFIFDSTGRLTSETLSSAEEFALGINKYNRMAFDLGLEAPFPDVTAFIEYALAYPLGSEGSGPCAGGYTGPDGVCVSAGQAMPQTLGIGLKVTAIQDLTPMIGLQFGLSTRVARGIPATQPFNFVFGLSYNLDPVAKGEQRIVEHPERKIVEAPPPTTGKITGVVLDSETKKPVGGALITVDSGALPPVASDPTAGKFISYELPPGKVAVSVVKDGYKPQAQDATVEVGKVASVEINLIREIKKATVTLKASAGKKPVVARFTFEGPTPVVGVTDASGAGTVEVPAGHLQVAINADGYLSKANQIDALEGGQVMLDVELSPTPKKPLVSIVENKIQVKQQVHFNTNKASILADSYPLLDQVIDAIVRANVKKLRIEGNTDNVGGKAHNLQLSQDRANSIKDYFVKNGVDAKSLEAVGNGDTKPVAPNLTSRGRELNRRVDFIILER